MSYQGWENYETWCVALWLNNDHGYYKHITTQARRTNKEDFAEYLKDFVEELLPDLEGFPADLLTHAVSQVDWFEIAESYYEDEQV